MIDRRTTLAGLSVVGTLLASDGPALAAKTARGAPPRELDASSPEGRLRTFILMRGALDQGLLTSWVSALYYGVVEDRMDPLFGVVSAVWARYRKVADGFEAVTAELAWFSDAETGKALDDWRNPYTGK